MKSYIVTGVDDVDKRMLHNNGVVFYPWDTDIVIDQTQLDLVLSLLNATATEAATEFENMYKLTLQFNVIAPAGNTTKNRAVDRARAQSRAKYIEVCSSRLNEFLVEATTKTSEARQKLLPAQSNFVLSARLRYLADKSKPADELKREFDEQFQRLTQIPKVETVRVTNGAILIYTDTLYATNPNSGLSHELGKFLIVIHTNGDRDGVRWFNRTRRVRTVQPGMNAPRVFADGTACADEIKETLLELMSQFDFATMTELAIQFVETLTDDEPSKYIDRWPCAQS